MKKITLSLLITTAALLLLTACGPQSAEATPAPVNTEPQAIIAEGRLLPANTLDQSFSVPGTIAEVLIKDGDTVEPGQVLAHLESSPEASLALARAEQEALSARQALDTLKLNADLNLAQSQVALLAAQEALDDAQTRYNSDDSDQNQAELDAAAARLALAENLQTKLAAAAGIDPDAQAAAEARLTSASAALDSARAALDARELKAALAGKIVDLNLQAGQRVNAAAPVLTIADLSGWVVKTDNLTEVEVVNIAVGQKAQIVLDALPDVTLEGEVTSIATRYAEKRGDITYTITIQLTQTDPAMRWGMTAAVKFLP